MIEKRHISHKVEIIISLINKKVVEWWSSCGNKEFAEKPITLVMSKACK